MLVQSPMDYFTWLAAWLLYILLLGLVITFCNVLYSYRRPWDQSSVWAFNQEPLNRNKQRRANQSFELLVIMVLIAICGLLLLGHLPSASSLQSGLRPIAGFSSQTPSSTGLQEFFQLYQPISLNSSEKNSCDVELLLMDHVFGASYGAPFVGKRSRRLLLPVV